MSVASKLELEKAFAAVASDLDGAIEGAWTYDDNDDVKNGRLIGLTEARHLIGVVLKTYRIGRSK